MSRNYIIDTLQILTNSYDIIIILVTACRFASKDISMELLTE